MAIINNYQMDVRSTPPARYFNKLDKDWILLFQLQSYSGEEKEGKRGNNHLEGNFQPFLCFQHKALKLTD